MSAILNDGLCRVPARGPITFGHGHYLQHAHDVIYDFREEFQAGAFGSVSALDVILNRQHDRRMPLARTGGGGLVLTDSTASALRLWPICRALGTRTTP